MKKLIISPKDTTGKIEMEVDFYWQEGNCLCLQLADGRIRMYPMIHIWYFEVEELWKTRPTKEG